ncbi:alpha/beta fold hydrolase [Streptacidiphilus cavernicola]|uniref:Alpha/beta fold hydrolase n=1 Tax=Streptacidiphilus cavernicola TaxID=3342716 RepID=A0ABV6W181_9ACTN
MEKILVDVRRVGDSQSTSADIVLLHGLGGDGHGTWTYPSKKGAPLSWPDWLTEDDSRFAVWCVNYPASATRWHGKSMPIRDRATNLLAALRDGHDIGRRPFVLVGHSLGGLVIKQIIRHSNTMGDQYSGFCENLAGVVFFSTPHTGSGLASLLGYLRTVRATPLVRELADDHTYLRELDDWYRNYATRTELANLSFYETQDTKGLRVVGESSGNPHLPGATAIPVDADHRTVCKFSDRSDLTYVQVKRFLVQRVGEQVAPTVPRPREEPPRIPAAASAPPRAGGSAWSDPDAVAEKVLLALLSEQLPSGGWARSLARWMTEYANASEMQAPDRPPMRVHGGIDVTCAALNSLVTVGDGSSERLQAAIGESLRAGANFLRLRTASGGAVGATIQTRTAPTEVRIRHTAITLATLLRLQRAFGEESPYPEVVRSAKYLESSLRHWRLDTSGTFGMTAGAWALYELLAHDNEILGSHLSEKLRNTLSTTVDEMAQELEGRVSAPLADTSPQAACARFGAYGNLVALAQSSFLFSAQQLTSLHLGRMPLGLAQQYLYEQTVATCQQLAVAVLQGEHTRDGLLTVPTPNGPRPDIGLSIQALSVFDDLCAARSSDDRVSTASDIVRRALDRVFSSTDEVELKERLRFTHGVQFAGLLRDPTIAEAFRVDRTLHLTAARTSRKTLSQRDVSDQAVLCAEHRGRSTGAVDTPRHRAWARAWSRTLENGHYVSPDQQSEPSAATAWRPRQATVRAVLQVLSEHAESDVLWIAGEAEESVGLVPPSRSRLVRADFPVWLDPESSSASRGFDLVYLPTAASSARPGVLISALRRARESLSGARAQGVMCVRFGDHRLVSESNEGILFTESSAQLEHILHDCRLRLLGIDNTDESLDGVESVIRFSAGV